MNKNNTSASFQNNLVLENMEYARKLARKFYRERRCDAVEIEELESAAMLGLCDAARRFNPDFGHNFRTFSFFRIRGAMFDLLRKNYWPVRPLFREQSISAENDFENVDEGSVDRNWVSDDSSDDGVGTFPFAFAANAEELGAIAETLRDLDNSQWVSLDTCDPSIADPARTPESLALIRNTRQLLIDLLEGLPDSERQIVELHYFRDTTFEQLGSSFEGVSKSWISRLHKRAIRRLQKNILLSEQYQDLSGPGSHFAQVFE